MPLTPLTPLAPLTLLCLTLLAAHVTAAPPSPPPSPPPSAPATPHIVGDGSPAYHPIRIDFRGPTFSPTDGRLDPDANPSPNDVNPFLDRRLQVRFTAPTGDTYSVPGYFDGDGKGREGGGGEGGREGGGRGDVWRVRFTPDSPGRWSYTATLRAGRNIAVDLGPQAGTPVYVGDFDSQGTATGTFTVADRDPDAPGFLGRGRLIYIGDQVGDAGDGEDPTRSEAASHYLHTAGDGRVWIKTGTDSPENWLGYAGFAHTRTARGKLHTFAAHIEDWRPGDPDWNDGDAKGIIGAINYLADCGVNSIYFLPMNIGGDGQDSHPYLDRGPDEGRLDLAGSTARGGRGGGGGNDHTHFDLARLAQWERFFDHCQRRGVALHIVLNEAEEANKRELDDATLGPARKLFYREIAARFAHHNALIWNLSEEYDYQLRLPPERIKEFAAYLDAVDAYDHPTTVHNQGSLKNPQRSPWTPFLGDDRFDLTSFQWANKVDGWGEVVESYRVASREAGRAIPIMVDEAGSIDRDAKGADRVRRRMTYPMLLSGAGGVEWFTEGLDQSLDDFRPFEQVYEQTAHARKLIESTTADRGEPADELVRGVKDVEVLAVPGEVYLVYLPDADALRAAKADRGEKGGQVELDLTGHAGRYTVAAFDPASGTYLADAPPAIIEGEQWVELPRPGSGRKPGDRDLVLVVQRVERH